MQRTVICCFTFSPARANHHGNHQVLSGTTIEGAFSINTSLSTNNDHQEEEEAHREMSDKERRLFHGTRQFRDLTPKGGQGGISGELPEQDGADLRSGKRQSTT